LVSTESFLIVSPSLCKSQLLAHGKLASTEKFTIASFYIIAESLIASFNYTVGICNKAKVDKHRLIPYCESFLYYESRLFEHEKLVSTEKCTIASFYTITEFLIASSHCI